MNLKKNRFVLLLLFCLFPALTFGVEKADSVSPKRDPIAGINTFVKEKTPVSVKNALDAGTKFSEKARADISKDLTNKKNEVRKEIEKLTKDKKQNASNLALELLKYLELLFLSLAYFVFSNGIFFYCFLLLTVFFVLRFLWRLIF